MCQSSVVHDGPQVRVPSFLHVTLVTAPIFVIFSVGISFRQDYMCIVRDYNMSEIIDLTVDKRPPICIGDEEGNSKEYCLFWRSGSALIASGAPRCEEFRAPLVEGEGGMLE